jgi:hypothetical protein
VGARGKLAVFVLVLAGGIAGLVFLTRNPADPPPPSPPPSVPVDPRVIKDYDDDIEEAVAEVEDVMLDFSRQIRQRAFGGAAFHVAEDFEGSPLLRDATGEERVVGGVTLRAGGPDARKVDRAGFRASLEDIDVERLLFKFPAATLDGRERLVCTMKADAQRTAGGRSKRWVSTGDAEFVRRDNRWLLRGFQGKEIRTEEGAVRFLDVTGTLALQFPAGNDPREPTDLAYVYSFLGGLAAADYDGDGDVDLLFTRIGRPYLFRNDGGHFMECAEELGISERNAGAGAVFLDYDNDGDLDLLIVNTEPAKVRDLDTNRVRENAGHRALSLWRNDGEKFTDVTDAAGLRRFGPAMSVCAADVDRDGDLDVYVCMYEDVRTPDPRLVEVVPPVVYEARNGEPNLLFVNQGNGTFREEAAARGVADTGWSFAAGFADFDGDGDADLYVANDYGDNRLYRNRGDGTFEDVSAASKSTDTGFGMGVAWLDYDGDGKLDLYVSNMYSTAGNRVLGRGPGKLPEEEYRKILKLAKGNTLLRNRGDGTFEDVTEPMGVGRAGWAWHAAPYDYDNDGRLDLYVANGFRTADAAEASAADL